MSEIKLKNIVLDISTEQKAVRVSFEDHSILLPNQKVDNVIELLKNNFVEVFENYETKNSHCSQEQFPSIDIQRISIEVVLHYLYMYNMWRNIYKKQENKQLLFDNKDFFRDSSYDIIIMFCKKNYLNDWTEKAAILLGMSDDQFKNYYKEREKYYNK